MTSDSFKNIIKLFLEIIYLIYMYKMDLALNNQLCLIYYKTKQNQNLPEFIFSSGSGL